MEPTPIVLHFQPPALERGNWKPVRDGLSSVVKVGDYLFMACDEAISLERLKIDVNGYAEHTTFLLSEYIPLSDQEQSEIDIEGMDYQNHYLWITGSHGLKRKKPQPDESVKKQLKQLAKVQAEPNRYVLARIPLAKNADTGEYYPIRSCPHPDKPGKLLTAARLTASEYANELTDALQEDKHLKDFLRIPGKDNGFDIEGLALHGPSIFLGLRGPVLRGWAIILEIQTEEADDHTLQLKAMGPKGKKYKKHFVDLAGMGIRELTHTGNDLLILAGPTMQLDGTIAVYRWKDALIHSQEDQHSLICRPRVERLFDIPHGLGENAGKDRAEGITLLNEDQLLVVYDSPSQLRKREATDVIADIFPLK